MAGFEPTNTGIKIRCLTAWRHPNGLMGREMGIEPTTSRTTIWRSNQLSYSRHFLKVARLKRFELLTPALEGRCSIQLSYRRILNFVSGLFALMERVMGIGPTQPAWKAGILPLNYTRNFIMLIKFTKIYGLCQTFLLDFLRFFYKKFYLLHIVYF